MNNYPKEVEGVIDGIAGVLESVVIGVADSDLGEVAVAIVVPEPGVLLNAQSLPEEARGCLASLKVPKRIEIVDSLPRNSMCKVEKATLRRRFGD